VEVRTLAHDAFGASDTKQAVVAFDEPAYRLQWASLVGRDEQPPAVDFTREAAVFVMGGQYATGGYSVDVKGVTLEGETLVLDAAVEGPPAGSMTAQVITSPYAVIAVKSRSFKTLRWP